MSLPNPIIRILSHFQPAFTRPTWHKVLVLGRVCKLSRTGVAPPSRRHPLRHGQCQRDAGTTSLQTRPSTRSKNLLEKGP
jgi:hypothetical protein